MITAMNRKFPGIGGEQTFLYVFHMSAVDPNGHIMLTFASHGAGVAANTHAIIDDKSVIHF
jgi:hypothetical protein|tara:strand:- start:199 stop:381 length:183 start_codon:yes stop_codon:yes gene_type:complete